MGRLLAGCRKTSRITRAFRWRITLNHTPASASDAASLGETLDAHLLYFDDLAGLRVFDRRGDMRYSSNGAHTAPTNVADRDYFRFLQNRPQSGLLFSEVIVSRITGRPSLIIARALQDPHGVFLGLVTAALDLDHYVEIFRLVDVGNNGVISFRRSDDHRQVVRWPSGPGKMNQELDPGHPLRPPMARGDRTGTLHFASQTDGVPRIYSFHRLEHYPFYFIIGVSFDDVLAGWRTRAQVIGACGFLLLALFAALLLRLWRSEAREALVVASLVDSERQQRDNSKRLQIFERLVENAGQGIGMAHPDGTITYANPALRCLLDLPVNAAYNDYSFNHFYSGENSRRLREEVLPTLLQTGQWTGNCGKPCSKVRYGTFCTTEERRIVLGADEYFAGFWRSRRGYALPLATCWPGRSIRTQRRGDHGQRPRQPHPGGQPGLLSPHRLWRRRGTRQDPAPVVVGRSSPETYRAMWQSITAAATGRARSGTVARMAASTRNGCRSRPSAAPTATSNITSAASSTSPSARRPKKRSATSRISIP
jgi:hypothetical protein